MIEHRTPLSEGAGFEEVDGGFRIRLGEGITPTFDEKGQAVIVVSPSIRRQLLSTSRTDPAGQGEPDETWNAWRQGP
jgi:hypothetical protein